MDSPDNQINPAKAHRISKEGNQRVKNPLSAIRVRCIDCVGGSLKTVRKCKHIDCHLYPYRFGKNPYHGKEKPEGYLSPTKAIRAECLSCNLSAHEVRLCPCGFCAIHPLRFGINPFVSDKKREAGRKAMQKLKNTRSTSSSENDSFGEYPGNG